jgi:molecular chaperone HtpG
MTDENQKTPAVVEERRAYIGSYVLESLTTGMYDEPRHAIREYVQNGFDAIRRARRNRWLKPEEGTIVISLDSSASSLTIRDDGTGISSLSAWKILSSVGASSKDRREQAGFRGIGRLAGIAYCERLRFITKYRGELEETTVTFDCERFRKGMDPQRDAGEDVQTLLTESIKDTRRRVSDAEAPLHYTRVVLEDLNQAPSEITDVGELKSYLSQTAPVGFHPEWLFSDQILAASKESDEPLDAVKMELHHYPATEDLARRAERTVDDGVDTALALDDPNRQPDRYVIYKPYRPVQSPKSRKPVRVTGIRLLKDEAIPPKWWGWVGITQLLASLKDDDASGLRIRMWNIQIDGTAITDQLFGEVRASYDRFNHWYIGEIHVTSDQLIPNARRDGFEENKAWRDIKNELSPICRDLSAKPYAASNRRAKVKQLGKDIEAFTEKVSVRLSEGAPLDPDEQEMLLANVAQLAGRANDESSQDLVSAEDAARLSGFLATANSTRRRLESAKVAHPAQLTTTAEADAVLDTVFSVLADMLEPPLYRRIRRIVEERIRALDG